MQKAPHQGCSGLGRWCGTTASHAWPLCTEVGTCARYRKATVPATEFRDLSDRLLVGYCASASVDIARSARSARRF